MAKNGKTMKGKSFAAPQIPLYKPRVYFGDGNVPEPLRAAKPGSKVSLVVTGKVVCRTEDAKGVANVEFEIGKVGGREAPGRGGKKAK